MAYGNFGEAREGMKTATYGAISYLTYFVIHKGKLNEDGEHVFEFDTKDRVLIPYYNGILGEIENMRVFSLVEKNAELYVRTDIVDETYSLTDYCTDIQVVGAIWNIMDILYQYFD